MTRKWKLGGRSVGWHSGCRLRHRAFGEASDQAGKTGRIRSERWLLWTLLTLGCLFFLQARSHAAAEVSREFRIKAASLQWFPYYVEWPSAAFENKDSPVLIGILGADPFREALEELLDKKVNGREVKVVRFATLENVRDCHVLYVNLPDRRDVQRALDLVREKPILTVSDQDGFIDQGGMVSLLKFKNRLKPHINNAAARRAGLIINSRLLTVSEVVKP